MNLHVRRRTWLAGLLVTSMAGAASAQHPPQPAGTLELGCGPQSPLIAPASGIQIMAGQESRRMLFGTGESVIVNAGTEQGIKTGQEFFIRRLVEDRYTEPYPKYFPLSLHTAGWLKIVEARENVSVATVTHACDSITPGDFLERFEPVAGPAASLGDEADFEQPARLILADERRQMGASGALMVLDRGTGHGLKPGQRLTIFRHTLDGKGPVLRVGSATAMVIGPETSLVRIENSIDAVYVGDLVAVHK